MEELWLVCEGGPESVDVAVLQSIFTRVLAAGITVVPSGGSSPGVTAANLNSRGDRAGYVIDRDYKSPEQAEAAYHDGKNGFIWRRHSIENYLLAPPVIVRAFFRLRSRAEHQANGPLPAWVQALPTDLATIAEALQEGARTRAPEEACRMTVQRLWEDLSTTAGQIQKRIPSLPTGHEIHDPEGWREALRSETQRLREAVMQSAESPHLQEPAIVARFEEVYSGFTTEDYSSNLRFLVDFHGRDLLRQFRNWLENRGVRLRYERVVNELVDAVAEVYAADRTIYGTDDFLDLANGVRAWANLPLLP